jgi:O-acetyl-ADP-ribose deacetylase (regulator of RNase III)
LYLRVVKVYDNKIDRSTEVNFSKMNLKSNKPTALVIAVGKIFTTDEIIKYFSFVEGIDIEEDCEKSQIWSNDWYFRIDQDKMHAVGVSATTFNLQRRELVVYECPSVIFTAPAGVSVPTIDLLVGSIQISEGRPVSLCESGTNSETGNSVRLYCAPGDFELLSALKTFRCRGVSLTVVGSDKEQEYFLKVHAVDGGPALSSQQISDAIEAFHDVSVELLPGRGDLAGIGVGAGVAVFYCSAEDAAKLEDVADLRAAGRFFSLSVERLKAVTAVQQAVPIAEALHAEVAHMAVSSNLLPTATDSSSATFLPMMSSASTSVFESEYPSKSLASERTDVKYIPRKLSESSLSVVREKVYHVDVFHDVENCMCQQGRGLQAPLLKELTLREVFTAYLGNRRQAEDINLAHVNVCWNFVLNHNPANIFHPELGFVDDMRTCGATIVHPGTKSDAVDTEIKSMLTKYIHNRSRSVQDDLLCTHHHLCVLITSDRDFANELNSLGLHRIDTILVHNENDPRTKTFTTNAAFTTLVPTGFSLGIWKDIVDRSCVGVSSRLTTSVSRNSQDKDRSSKATMDESGDVVQRLIAHICACGYAIEASKMSIFYNLQRPNKAELEAVGTVKKVCQYSGGRLAWRNGEESVGYGFIVAAAPDGVEGALVPMTKHAFHFLQVYLKNQVERDVEAVANGCSVEFVSKRNGAANISLRNVESTILKKARVCVDCFVAGVKSQVVGFNGIGWAELQRNAELETLKQDSQVMVLFNKIPEDAAAPSFSAVHEVCVSIAKTMLNPRSALIPSESAKMALKNYLKQKLGIDLDLDRFSVVSNKPLWVNLKVTVFDKATKTRALAIQTDNARMIITDVSPSVMSTKLEFVSCTILHFEAPPTNKVAPNTEGTAGIAGLNKVIKFIGGLCKVMVTVKIDNYHRFLFVKETWAHLVALVENEVDGVGLKLGDFVKGATISLFGISTSVDAARTIVNENLSQLLELNCAVNLATFTANAEFFEVAMKFELNRQLHQQAVTTVRYFLSHKDADATKLPMPMPPNVGEKVVSSVKVVAYAPARALFDCCTAAASDLSVSCSTTKTKLPPNNDLDLKALKQNFGIYINVRSGELCMVGLPDKVLEVAAHVGQLLNGSKPATRHLAFPGVDSVQVAKYFALPAVRPIVLDICNTIKTSLPVSVSVCTDNSANILILNGKSATIQSASDRALVLLDEHVQRLVRRIVSSLSPHEVKWLSENRANIADNLAVLVDMSFSAATPTTSNLVQHTFSLNAVKVVVAKCDFIQVATELLCDCIVNSANSKLAHGTGIAHAIAVEGGSEFLQACNDVLTNSVSRSVPVGTAVVTLAFDRLLAHGFTHVVHLVAPRRQDATFRVLPSATDIEREQLGSAVCCALTEAAKAGVVRIAFPGIGTGVYAWPALESTTLVAETVSEWVAANANSSIREVVLFDLSDEVVGSYSAALTALETAVESAPSAPKIQPTIGPAPMLPANQAFWKVQSWELSEAMKPFLVEHADKDKSWMPYDIDQLEQLEGARLSGLAECTLIGDLSGEKNNSHYIVDFYNRTQTNTKTGYVRPVLFLAMDKQKPPPLFAERVVEYQRRLAVLTSMPATPHVVKPRAVCIAGSSSLSGSSPSPQEELTGILLYGSEEAVASTNSLILAAVESGKKRGTVDLSTLIALTKAPFAQVCADVKALFANSDVCIAEANAITSTLTLEGLGALSLSQATSAVQMHVNAQMSDYHKVKYPDGWTNTTPEGAPVLVELNPTDAEYVTAAGAFLTDFTAAIVRIERVENPALFKYFFLKLREIADRNGGDANVQLLKHGTRATDPEQVWSSGTTTNTYGFDHRFSYMSGYGQMYGKGNYFAEDTAYSHGYRYKLPGGEGQMFLASVAMGRVEQKAAPYCAEYSKIMNPGAGFQSVRGIINGSQYGIITYELHQTYPAYLITYRC